MITTLFDMDGTLIDSTEAILESFHSTFQRNGLNPPLNSSILPLIGLPLEEMFIRLDVPKELIGQLVKGYKKHYLKVHLNKTHLLPGATEAVNLAKRLGKIGIVTTKTSKYTKLLLERFGLLSLFDVVIGREEVNRLKPDPEPVLKAVKRVGGEVAESVLIGDTCLDMESARRAGATGIGVTTGFWDRREMERCSPYLVTGVLDAVHLLIAERF